MLSLVIVIGLCTSALAAGSTFGDVPADAWYYIPVTKATQLGLISGYGNNRFGPNDKVTYAQYATMLANICWEDEVKSYKDITKGQAWYMPYVLVCEDKGVFVGTQFEDCPDWTQANLPMTREAMAQMSYNFLSAADVDMSMTQAEELLGVARIKDYGAIDAGNQEAVVWCYVEGVLNGYSNGNFGPKDTLTRAQAATVLCQVYGRATGDVTGTGKPVVKPPVAAAKPSDAIGGQYDVSVFTVPADVNKDGYLTEAEVQAVLDALKVEFAPGTLWNDASVWGTDPKSPNGYINFKYSKHPEGIHYYRGSSAMGGGTGCAAYAKLISDRIFGNLPARELTDVSSMHIGDVFYSHVPHWWVMTGEKSGYPTATDSGSNPGDTIAWSAGNSTFNELQELVDSGKADIYTRYPAE